MTCFGYTVVVEPDRRELKCLGDSIARCGSAAEAPGFIDHCFWDCGTTETQWGYASRLRVIEIVASKFAGVTDLCAGICGKINDRNL